MSLVPHDIIRVKEILVNQPGGTKQGSAAFDRICLALDAAEHTAEQRRLLLHDLRVGMRAIKVVFEGRLG